MFVLDQLAAVTPAYWCVLFALVGATGWSCWWLLHPADAPSSTQLACPWGAIDDVLQANGFYVQTFAGGHLSSRPARRLAVVACMDARIDVEQVLGLQPGEANVIRNAGGIVTEDTLRSLIVSQQLLGTREVMIINHTECGLLTFEDDELCGRLRRVTGKSPAGPVCFHAFHDLRANVQAQCRAVKQHPWIAHDVRVRGFIYDVRTGSLSEVL